MKWFTSDLHFSHANVIRYCQRPFENVHQMNTYLTKIWNETIGVNDTVYCLGDFCMNPKTSHIITPQLNGRKILIPGNHDGCFDFKPKLPTDKKCVDATILRHAKMLKRYQADGWEAIHQTLRLTLKNGTEVLLAHLPYAPKDGENLDMRYLEYRPKDDGGILLHGHIHGRYKKLRNMIDVGVDAHGLTILSEDDVIKLIESPEQFIASPLTEFYKNRG